MHYKFCIKSSMFLIGSADAVFIVTMFIVKPKQIENTSIHVAIQPMLPHDSQGNNVLSFYFQLLKPVTRHFIEHLDINGMVVFLVGDQNLLPCHGLPAFQFRQDVLPELIPHIFFCKRPLTCVARMEIP